LIVHKGQIIHTLRINDYKEIKTLWDAEAGIIQRDWETKERYAILIRRNFETSVSIRDNNQIIAAALAGTDGWRGYLYHLVVRNTHRRQGYAELLIDYISERFKSQKVSRVHVLTAIENEVGRSFFSHLGFQQRTDVTLFSRDT